MNERIFTELYKKAWGHFPCPTGEPELEKFAELLIRECAGLVQGVPTDTMGYHTADQKIKEHFGFK